MKIVLLGFSQIALQGDWSNLSIGVIESIIGGALLSGFVWCIVRLTNLIRQFIKIAGVYDITGIWIGPCKLPRHPPKVEAVEIYRLFTKKEHVTFTIFHYVPDVKKITKYAGAGIFRGEVLSAFYYVPAPQSFESGVFVMHQAGQKFKGVYAQYDPVANMKLYIRSEEDFILRRVQLSLWAQMKMMLGVPPFPCYQRAKALYDRAVTEEPE